MTYHFEGVLEPRLFRLPAKGAVEVAGLSTLPDWAGGIVEFVAPLHGETPQPKLPDKWDREKLHYALSHYGLQGLSEQLRRVYEPDHYDPNDHRFQESAIPELRTEYNMKPALESMGYKAASYPKLGLLLFPGWTPSAYHLWHEVAHVVEVALGAPESEDWCDRFAELMESESEPQPVPPPARAKLAPYTEVK